MATARMPPESSAALIARFLKARGVDRVFGLCGGHVMPMWMAVDAAGIAIVDVRDERAAVHMAHAYGELTGRFGVALVTAGPGVTNAVTGVAHAHVARAPVLVLSGLPPRAQENRGALQDVAHAEILRPITRYARTVREPTLVLQELDEAVARAEGAGGEPGPAYLDFPVDVQRAEVPAALVRDEHLCPKPRWRGHPAPDAVRAAADLLWSARRPLVVSGRGARGAGPALVRLLDALGAPYLDTGESRGLVPESHPSVVAAMRGTVLGAADVVLTVGRRLDFQLAYGSPAIFGPAKFVRIADAAAELRDNRRGDVELLADCGVALEAIVGAANGRASAIDRTWATDLRAQHEERTAKLAAAMRATPEDARGRILPNFLLACLSDRIGRDAVLVADGGDFLSFARVGTSPATWMDPGSLGCLGVGVPFGIAASLACPDRTVVVATGDGAFGFNAIEIDTAVRHRAGVLVVVANNAAWQIEVHDQRETHGRIVGTQLQSADYAAMARAFGMHAERIERAAELPSAIDRALARRPALLDVVVSPDAVSSDAKSGLAWVPDLQPLAAWDDAERRWRAR
jgi:acetolactate synthase-1/2/3 large subunit